MDLSKESEARTEFSPEFRRELVQGSLLGVSIESSSPWSGQSSPHVRSSKTGAGRRVLESSRYEPSRKAPARPRGASRT